MKKKLTLSMSIIGSVLALILIAVLVLSFVRVSPLKNFYNYERVVISVSGNNNLGDLTAPGNESKKESFDKALKKSSFSVMHSLLEGAFGYGPQYVYELDENDKIVKDDDGNKVKPELTHKEVTDATVADETNYVLEFIYAQENSIKVKGDEIKFDRMRVKFGTSSGELIKVTIYPYLSNLVNAEGNAQVEEYRINPLSVRVNTTHLFLALTDIIANV